MSGSRDALARLVAALDPMLTDAHVPHPLRRAAALGSERGDFLDVAEAIVPLILDAEAAADALAAHAKRLRAALAEVMDETGAAAIRSETHTASVSRGRAAVVITDPDQIPKDLWRVPEPQPDKAAIAKLLSKGEPIPGAVLGNAAPTLTIRSKER